MAEGYVKLNRNITKWEWFTDPYMCQIWVYILANTNWETRNWKGVEVPKGSFITGRKKIAKETGMSEQRVRTCIERLKSTNEITVKSTNKYSLITVNKWEDYQCFDEIATNKSTNKLANEQPTTNQQLTTTKNNKNYKNIKNKYIGSESEPIYDTSKNPKFNEDLS